MIICAKMNTIILFRITNVLSHIILFACLVQSAQSGPPNSTDGGSDPLSVLRCVCDIRNVTSEEVTINTLPAYCTAAAISSNNDDDVKTISSAKTTDIPFIQYFNGYTYELWDDYLNDSQKFIENMKEFKLDGYIFDRMYQTNEAPYDEAKNQAICTFFQNLKQANPKGLFGLALFRHADLLPTAFNYDLLDPVVDFYVIQTIDYRDCIFQDDFFKMERTCTIGDMRKSLNALRQSISLQKVLLTVQVFSIGITQNAQNGSTLITYSDMCHYKGKRLSRHRKYCKDSIETLYEKGQLVVEFGMLGVYIQYIDYDDFAGSCGCATANGDDKFPATAAIVAGMDPNATAPDFCHDFGNYDDTSAESAPEANN